MLHWLIEIGWSAVEWTPETVTFFYLTFSQVIYTPKSKGSNTVIHMETFHSYGLFRHCFDTLSILLGLVQENICTVLWNKSKLQWFLILPAGDVTHLSCCCLSRFPYILLELKHLITQTQYPDSVTFLNMKEQLSVQLLVLFWDFDFGGWIHWQSKCGF